MHSYTVNKSIEGVKTLAWILGIIKFDLWPEESSLDGWGVDDDRIFLVITCVGGDGHDRVDT